VYNPVERLNLEGSSKCDLIIAEIRGFINRVGKMDINKQKISTKLISTKKTGYIFHELTRGIKLRYN